MKVHSRNNKGGNVQIKQSILDDVHAMVQLHRQSKSLEPWDFVNRTVMKTVTPEAIDNYFSGGATPEERMSKYLSACKDSDDMSTIDNPAKWTDTIDQLCRLEVGAERILYPDEDNVTRWASNLRSILSVNRKTYLDKYSVTVKDREVIVKKTGHWSAGNELVRSLPLVEVIKESEANMNMEVYTAKEVNDAIQHLEDKNGSIRHSVKAGDQRLKCACNCGGYVPIGNSMQGWTFIHGHKNSNSNGKRSQTKLPVTRGEAYESLLDRIRMDIANVEGEMKSVAQEANKLTVKLQTLKVDLDKLKAAEQALKPLAMSTSNGAH